LKHSSTIDKLKADDVATSRPISVSSILHFFINLVIENSKREDKKSQNRLIFKLFKQFTVPKEKETIFWN